MPKTALPHLGNLPKLSASGTCTPKGRTSPLLSRSSQAGTNGMVKSLFSFAGGAAADIFSASTGRDSSSEASEWGKTRANKSSSQMMPQKNSGGHMPVGANHSATHLQSLKNTSAGQMPGLSGTSSGELSVEELVIETTARPAQASLYSARGAARPARPVVPPLAMSRSNSGVSSPHEERDGRSPSSPNGSGKDLLSHGPLATVAARGSSRTRGASGGGANRKLLLEKIDTTSRSSSPDGHGPQSPVAKDNSPARSPRDSPLLSRKKHVRGASRDHHPRRSGSPRQEPADEPAEAIAELDQVIRTQLAPPVARGHSVGRPIERAVSVHQRGPFKYELGDFVLQKSLGQGAFAKVYLVKRNVDGKLFALKSMRKDNVVKMQQVQHVQNERHLMENIRNPFLVGLEATFQDSQHIFMIIDYMPGGDLFGHIQRQGHFNEPLARFYATEVAMALSYLHSENIVYRDLKPENVLLDVTGHARLGDFGFAKVIDGTTRTFCGTPSYIPPEILLHKEYSGAVDWWSFGVLLFEMLSGCSPFQEDTAAKTYERILNGVIQWPSNRSKYFSRPAEDLIVALLVFSPFQRLGCQDESEIRDHAFFASVDWRAVKLRRQQPPHDNTKTLRKSQSFGDPATIDNTTEGATTFEISAWRSNSVADPKHRTDYTQEMFKDF
ncbi:kinase-like domain-containing protein [Geranomyces variabilis]|nr:kinase-like domain-containing protein [Geranomyces variabilis]KAJ3137827.1 camp-dependent protein kinase catalytic subunit [Geranomyces variabilis]